MKRPTWDFFILVGFCLTLSSLSAQRPPQSDDPSALPDLKRLVHHRMREAAESQLDLSAVRDATSPLLQRKATLEVLEEIMENGPDALAQHALTFLSYAPASELEASVRRRLTKLPEAGSDWTRKHLRFSAQRYLSQLGDVECREALIAKIDDPDVTVRTRVYRLLRDSAEESWVTPAVAESLRTRTESEPDPVARVAANGAYAACAPSSGEKTGALSKMEARDQQGEGREKLRAKLERTWVELKEGERTRGRQPASPEVSRQIRNELLELAEVGRHDERMFALETLAAFGDAGIDDEIAAWAVSEDWRQRLGSAFYLVLTQNRKEAGKRLQTENHPMVQTALLSALAQQETASPTKKAGR